MDGWMDGWREKVYLAYPMQVTFSGVRTNVQVVDDDRHTWSASYVVICCVIVVISLTLVITAFAVTSAVNLGRTDLHTRTSTVFCSQRDSDHLPRQSSSNTVEVFHPAAELKPGQVVVKVGRSCM